MPCYRRHAGSDPASCRRRANQRRELLAEGQAARWHHGASGEDEGDDDGWVRLKVPTGSKVGQFQSAVDTGHEQHLIHMNGRVYDPLLGRFGTPTR